MYIYLLFCFVFLFFLSQKLIPGARSRYFWEIWTSREGFSITVSPQIGSEPNNYPQFSTTKISGMREERGLSRPVRSWIMTTKGDKSLSNRSLYWWLCWHHCGCPSHTIFKDHALSQAFRQLQCSAHPTSVLSSWSLDFFAWHSGTATIWPFQLYSTPSHNNAYAHYAANLTRLHQVLPTTCHHCHSLELVPLVKVLFMNSFKSHNFLDAFSNHPN